MDQNIKVYVRCRPLAPNEKHSVVHVEPENGEIRIIERIVGGQSYQAKTFHFDQVFSPESQQIDIHTQVVTPLIEQVLLGFNCTVFAYGQTGSGKTYTMEGTGDDGGIIPRAISDLFDSLDGQDNEFHIRVSFLELYNEDTYDLLSSINDTSKLRIFNDDQKKGSVKVENLSEVPVQTKQQIYDILRTGSAKRQTAATLLNACSSRSHTIFTITAQIHDTSIHGEDMLKIGKLNLVDLAGSENIGRSGAQDKRAREAGNINQSLLTLGRVITALIEKRPHIPYRESNLTRLLQDSLGGSTKTSVIATISPSYEDADATTGTLEYALRARNIKNRPVINGKLTKSSLLSVDLHRNTISYDRHSSEMLDIEMKIRNEMVEEYKLAIDAMSKRFEDERIAKEREFEAEMMKRDAAQVERDAAKEKNKQLELRLEETELRLEETELRLEEAESRLAETESRLEETESRLAETESRLEETESRLKESELLLKETESGLKETESRLKETELRLKENESGLKGKEPENQKTRLRRNKDPELPSMSPPRKTRSRAVRVRLDL